LSTAKRLPVTKRLRRQGSELIVVSHNLKAIFWRGSGNFR
jgi:hypothetical protein